MAFRIQDLMMDVQAGGWQMANPECTCQVTVKPGVQRERTLPEEEPRPHPGKGPGVPDDHPVCQDTLLPPDVPPPGRREALAADLAALRAQLQRDLGQGA